MLLSIWLVNYDISTNSCDLSRNQTEIPRILESSRRSEWRASLHWNILDDFLENPFFLYVGNQPFASRLIKKY